MSTGEFGLIDRYFKKIPGFNAAVKLGIGDDCALLDIPEGYELALTTDTMVEGIHFLPGADPETLGHKILAVNLSDLASMGARPVSVMLALTLPTVYDSWLTAFAKGFFSLAECFQVDLIGGDTTRGPLTLTLQALGLIPKGKALKRSAAKAGDIICMTGSLGDAGLGLKIAQGLTIADSATSLQRFHTPMPRIAEGLAIRDHAHACIDISDGLVADLKHILKASGVGAHLEWERLPLSNAVKHYIDTTGDWQMPLVAGDDYELCFTIPEANLSALSIPYTAIGRIDQDQGVRIYKSATLQTLTQQGYEHFS